MLQSAYQLLSEPIRKFINEKQWDQLRPIQTAAIIKISTTKYNYILSSRTASGKTEAAFLPILSNTNFENPGIKVLYISPLIALINDQFIRIESLCKYMDINITKWHGEASKALKDRLSKTPNGIVLITPESIEAMLVNKKYLAKHLFTDLEYIIIDEIHAFIGTDRGIQLKSLLFRLHDLQKGEKARIIGLSATISDFTEAKKFTGNVDNTKVLIDRTGREINIKFKFFNQSTRELPLPLLKDLYLESKDVKALIFPNSRGVTEEIAVKLKKISEKVGGHNNYFTHHSSIDKDLREYIENFAKNAVNENFSVVCTSTLELGIDIGSVDTIFQINSVYSISSLIQRIGRSGRRENSQSKLISYTTDKWSLLQSLACWLLYKENFIEPPPISDTPYDILVQQALSIIKSNNSLKLAILIDQLKNNYSFHQIDINDIYDIIEHLIKTDILESIGDEIIIGLEGEKIVNIKDFYSVFIPENNFKVSHAGNIIGDIALTPQIIEGENILLAAKIWKIVSIDIKAQKIEVIKTVEGNRPEFEGKGNWNIHSRVREKMFEILCSSTKYEELNENCAIEIEQLRNEFKFCRSNNLPHSRPIIVKEGYIEFYSFQGSKVNNALVFLMNKIGYKVKLFDKASCIEITGIMAELLNESLKDQELINNIIDDVDQLIQELIETKGSTQYSISKYCHLLPMKYQTKIYKDIFFDFTNAQIFLNNLNLISSQ